MGDTARGRPGSEGSNGSQGDGSRGDGSESSVNGATGVAADGVTRGQAEMITTARTDAGAPEDAITDLVRQLSSGVDPKVVVFFASPIHDGAKVSGRLRERWPSAEVVG